MSSSLAAFSGLKLKTLPMRLAVMLAMDPSSNRIRSQVTQAKCSSGSPGTGSTL